MAATSTRPADGLQFERFAGREANVNAYLVHNASHVVVVDCLRNRAEASELAQRVGELGLPVQAILVTHGHPDHYIGSRTLQEAFPQARIQVASESIKSDMVGFSQWMDSLGWLDKQPQMKPKGAGQPEGFDYGSRIEVLSGDRLELEGGGALVVESGYPATECGHMSTLFAPAEKTLLTGDLVYHGVHAWAGQGVERAHIANWVRTLGDLKAHYSDPGITVLPGHGPPCGTQQFDSMRMYLDDFVSAVDGEVTDAAAADRMKRLYPGFHEEAFLLAQSIAFHGPDSRSRRSSL